MRNCSAHARAGISRWWWKCTKWTARARAKALSREAEKAFRRDMGELRLALLAMGEHNRRSEQARERLTNPPRLRDGGIL